MKKFAIAALLVLTISCCFGWSFNGVDQKKIMSYRPAPGRFALTVAFQLTMPKRMLTPGNRGNVFYPLVISAGKTGKDTVSKIQLAFVTKPYDRYCFASITPGGRYNIAWINDGGEIPTDQPVWVFISAAAGGIFEARINGRNFSHVRTPGLMPLVQSAPEYKICLGCNPYRGGVGYTECEINNFMLFERVLSSEEMAAIEADPAVAATIPGRVKKLTEKKK